MAVFRYADSSLSRSMKAKRRLLFVVAAASAALVIGLGAILSRTLINQSKMAGQGLLSRKQIQKAWDQKDYQRVYGACRAALDNSPVDSYYLTFLGFSSFYLGVSQISDEEKMKYLDEAVASLRKAMVKNRVPMKREIHYVLGKAYFQRGFYYQDQAVKYLELALAERMRAQDIYEYLAMAYYSLGNDARSVEYFQKALAQHPSDQLYIAMSAALLKGGKKDEATALLEKAIGLTKDVTAEQKARFALCDIFIQDGAFDKATEQLNAILSEDDQSAEGHYQLGIIYQKNGDSARARSEWRKAVKIDPMHQASRLKLSEKTKSPEARS
jgi:tetratricopeptide (TPR) repeat protein